MRQPSCREIVRPLLEAAEVVLCRLKVVELQQVVQVMEVDRPGEALLLK